MKFLIFSFSLLLATVSLTAQKYAHCNFGELLSSMKETAVAEKTLKTYNAQLVAEGEKRAAELQGRIKAYGERQQLGTMSPQEAQKQEAILVADRDKLYAYEQEVAQKTDAKRQELLGPVISRANKTIEAIAKERGYRMVFDTSIFNAVIFADDSINIMAEAKKRLGIE